MNMNLTNAGDQPRSEIAARRGDRSAVGTESASLTSIYDDDVNIAIWQRKFSPDLEQLIEVCVARRPMISIAAAPRDIGQLVQNELGGQSSEALAADIAELSEMFACLFDLETVGLRLTVLRGSMCPRFHVDFVPCRMITTYCGVGTEWLAHGSVDRSKLGRGNNGKPDHESGVYTDVSLINRLNCGDVALLKGEAWQGNENAGLVHRSPEVGEGQSRLLMTLDFVD